MSLLIPRHDIASKIATGILAARDDVRVVSTMLHPDNFPSMALNEAPGLVGVDHQAITAANQVLNSKVLTNALKPRGLSANVTPQPLADAQSALVQARLDMKVPKGALKHPERFGKQPAAPLQAQLESLADSMTEAHFAVSGKEAKKAINAEAPVRKLAALTRLSVLGIGVTAGGVAAAQAVTGNDYVTPMVDGVKKQAGTIFP